MKNHRANRSVVGAFLLVGGCEAQGSADSGAATGDWTQWIEPLPSAEAWTPSELETALTAMFDLGFPNPIEVFADFDEIMTHAENSCPGGVSEAYANGGFGNPDGCTTSAGYVYLGTVGFMLDDARAYDDQGNWTGQYSRSTAPADFVISRGDGSTLGAGGSAMIDMEQSSPTDRSWDAMLTGTWFDDGQNNWLQPGFSGWMTASGRADSLGWSQSFDGSVALGPAAINLVELKTASTCPGGATGGMIEVRESAGSWGWIAYGNACSSCGDAYAPDGSAIGEACPDLGVLVNNAEGMVVP